MAIAIVDRLHGAEQLSLPMDLRRFVDAYYQAVPTTLKPRNPRLFVWSWAGSQILRFNTVAETFAEDLYETNVLAILLNVMVDDIADLLSAEKMHTELLEEALQIVTKGNRQGTAVCSPYEDYLELMIELRAHLRRRLASWPQSHSWKKETDTFLRRLETAMRFSAAWNRQWQPKHNVHHQDANIHLGSTHKSKIQLWCFDDYLQAMAPPIHAYIYGLFNLMLIDNNVIHARERQAILRVLIHGEQYLAMSNWLATWEVEVAERDFTSGVVIWALEQGILSPLQLLTMEPEQLVSQLHGCNVQNHFEWTMEQLAEDLLNQQEHIATFDAATYLQGLREVHALHLHHREMLKH